MGMHRSLLRFSMAALLVLLVLAFAAPLAAAAPPQQPKEVSNELQGDLTATEPRLVTLSWEDEPPSSLIVRVSVTGDLRATSITGEEGGREIKKALYVLEIEDGDGQAVGPEAFELYYTPLALAGESAMGWDSGDKFFYIGSRGGFKMTPGWDETIRIRIKALVAGDFSYKLYTLELP